MAAMPRINARRNPPMIICAARCWSGRGRVMPKVAMKVSVSQARSFIAQRQNSAEPMPENRAGYRAFAIASSRPLRKSMDSGAE
jgi:hypothetical protein